jgi:hypothetical protein
VIALEKPSTFWTDAHPAFAVKELALSRELVEIASAIWP